MPVKSVTLEVYIKLHTIQISHVILLPRVAWCGIILRFCSKLRASYYALPSTYYPELKYLACHYLKSKPEL